MKRARPDEGPEPLATAAVAALAFSALSFLWSALLLATVALSALAIAAALERWRPIAVLREGRYRADLLLALGFLTAGWGLYGVAFVLPLDLRGLTLALGTAGFSWRARRIPVATAFEGF